MSRKIPIQELAELLAKARSISTEAAESFIRSFFDIVAEGVTSGETVKVKGIGTFAPSDNPENPVEFTPDKTLADIINAPFAIFEPEPLSSTVTAETLAEIDEAEKESATVSEDSVTVQETEPDNETSEEPTMLSETETVSVQLVRPEIKPEPEIAEETTIEDNTTSAEPIAELPSPASSPLPEPIIATLPAPEPVTEPEPANVSEPAPVISEPVAEIKPRPIVSTPHPFPEEEPEEHVSSDEKPSKGIGQVWCFAIGLLVGAAFGACGVYLAINTLFPMPEIPQQEMLTEMTEEIQAMPETVVSSSAPSTPIADSIASVPADTVATAPTPATVNESNQNVAQQQNEVKDVIKPGYLIHEMARKHYGNKAFWVYIYEENKAKIGNPNRLSAGLELVIPPAEKYGIDSHNPASVKAANEKAGKILAKFPS